MPCGRWGTEEAKRRYDRAISEWLAAGRRLPVPEKELVTVAVLVDRYWSHVQSYYVQRDGSPTDEQNNIRQALRPLTRLYPDVSVDEFTPRQLKAVRQHMIDLGWSRPWINKSIRRIRRAFRWGVEEELVPENVHRALASVAGLKAGRTEAPEPAPVVPVSDEMIDATLPHLTPTLATMVRAQRLTGMRPQDVCQMTTGDIDMNGDVWEYRPPDHKTAWRGRTRIVYIGPEAQRILTPYMKTDPMVPIFSPRQSEAERRQAMREARKTPASCGNGPGDNRASKPRRAAADRWNTASYGRAITYACDQAFPPPSHLAKQRVPAKGRKRERWETSGEWRARLKRQGLLDELEKW
ncbi:MAG: site-specific integrase [bacterium]